MPGVTSGKIAPAFRAIGPITKVGGGQLGASVGDLEVSAGWGALQQGSVTMPGEGRAEEGEYDEKEADAISSEAGARRNVRDGSAVPHRR